MSNVYFIDGELLITKNETEVTVDGIHLNDHGMSLFATRLAPYIAAHLKR
jgi:lysophospholipase L1-like esterase